MNIDISKIKLHESLQSRSVMSQETIDEYTESLLDGVKLPGILVYFDENTYWLVDGYHRYFAHKKAGFKEIEAEIVQGTFRDAELRSTGVNYGHGLQRTNQDKRKAVMKLLNDLEWAEWSDREIARQCNVSNMTVIRIKKSLDIVNVEKKAIRNGTEFTFKPKAPVQKEPEAAPRPSETPVLDVVHEQLQELATAHEMLAEENAKLMDRIAINAMDATPEEKESAEQTLQELRAIIKTLEAENRALKASRDGLQNKNVELIKTVAYWQRRAEKAEKLAA